MIGLSSRTLGVLLGVVLLAACNENGPNRAQAVAITVFKATPATLAPGGNTTLEWSTRRASACTAGGDLPGWTGARDPSGSQALVIPNAGSYRATLTCEGAGGSASEALTVTVSASAVRIDSFGVSPATVLKGGTTTVSWSASNAVSCSAGGSLPGWAGPKNATGSEDLALNDLGSFEATLSCVGDEGESASEAVAVSVVETLPDVAIDAFSAAPSEIVVGGSVKLAWVTTGATACSAGGDLPGWEGDVPAVGSRLVTVQDEGEYSAQLTCSGGSGPDATAALTITVTLPTRHRYSMANQCFALRSALNGQYVVASGSGSTGSFAASGASLEEAEPFYLKSAALGDYLLYRGVPPDDLTPAQVVTAGISPGNPGGATCAPPSTSLCNVALNSANASAVFEVKGAGDATAYPVPPQFDVQPSIETVTAYRNFVDPYTRYSHFTFASKADGRLLTAATSGALSLAAPANPLTEAQQFILVDGPQGCATFPEAQNNAVGNTYKGTTPDGRVVGFADTHVHVTSTTFLGGAKAGAPFHKLGVTRAVGDCSKTHGQHGSNDFLMAAYQGDNDGHFTDGWPTFTDWPSREALSDEAMYWKWIERAWLGGQRILVNDLVDNGTLCELQRNAVDSNDPRSTSEKCNEMETAREQVGTTYAMQDYIDAQYGGRGKGFWRVVWSPQEARQVIADGKMAVIIGIELTNMFDCQMTYSPNPLRKEPYQEPTDAGPEAGENWYKCSMKETGAPNEIKTQLDHMVALGLRQIISIHEFDIAFGGNGIFNAVVLNLGNRENSGGNPTPGVPPNNPFDGADPNETPTGEFWTTYSCPTNEELAAQGDGPLWDSAIGQIMNESEDFVGTPGEGQPFPFGCAPPGPTPPGGPYSGQGGRYGGSVACYPAGWRQCNARLMTPIGLYLYKLLMERGLMIDFDHMAYEMKNQILTLSELQDPPYPTLSTHGTFGGTSLSQGRRVLANGGHLYPSLGTSTGFIDDMVETKGLWQQVASSPNRVDVFGFGFGTDTNGLSEQSRPRSGAAISADGEVTYPFTFFTGEVFDAIPEFATLDDDGDPATPYAGVTFNQPEEFDLAGASRRKWHADVDGTAHAGMVVDNLYEMQLAARAAAQRDSVPVAQRVEHIRDLYNSAEMYLQTWEKTLASQAGILANDNGGKAKGTAEQVLYAAPGPD